MKPHKPKASRPRKKALPVIAETRISPKKATLDLIRRALDALGHAPQLEVIQHLSVTELCKGTEEDLSALGPLTLGDLRALGGEELLRLLGQGPQGLKRARALASHLLSLPMITNTPPLERTPQVVRFPLDSPLDSSDQHGTLPLMNPKAGGPAAAGSTYRSTEAELKFIRLLDSLRTLSLPHSTLSRTLNEYWEPSWPDAPFEQALTLGQLLSTDIEAVLRKRSFTARKLSVLSAVLEKALRSAAPAEASVPSQSENAFSPALLGHEASRSSPVYSTWGRESDLGQSEADNSKDVALWAIETCLNRLPADHPLRVALLPLESVADLPTLRSLIAAAHENRATTPTPLAVHQTLQARLKSHASPFAALFTSALSGPAVSLSRLLLLARELSPLPSIEVWESSSPPLRLLFRILLRAHGANPAQYMNSPVPDVWTTNQKLLELVIESLRGDDRPAGENTGSESSLRKALVQALPLCDPESFELLFKEGEG